MSWIKKHYRLVATAAGAALAAACPFLAGELAAPCRIVATVFGYLGTGAPSP